MPIQAPQWTMDFLSCPICMYEFAVNLRQPISLACGHTICRTCLAQLHRQQCPFDQVSTFNIAPFLLHIFLIYFYYILFCYFALSNEHFLFLDKWLKRKRKLFFLLLSELLISCCCLTWRSFELLSNSILTWACLMRI